MTWVVYKHTPAETCACRLPGRLVVGSADPIDVMQATSSPVACDVDDEDIHVQLNNTAIPPIIPLNVGGMKYVTRLSTLLKYQDSMLAAMFSGRHSIDADSEGNFFIDSNGKYFGFILEFLRHHTMPTNDVAECVYREAVYFGLTELVDLLQYNPAVARRLVKESHRSQFPDYREVKQKVIRIAMENATVYDKPGEVLVHAFRAEFSPSVKHFNPQHSCVADQAHVTVGPWSANTQADEEIFIRALENDLVEDGYHIIKNESPKRRCKYYFGQSCQRCLWRVTIRF